MAALLILLFATADDPQALRLMTGKVVKIEGDSLTLSNSKERKTFTLTADTTIQVDRKSAKAAEIAVGDAATVTHPVDSFKAVKVQSTSAKAKTTPPENKKQPEAKKKPDESPKKKAKEEAEKESKRQQFEVVETAEGASFGPFLTDFGGMEVQAKLAGGDVELVVSVFIDRIALAKKAQRGGTPFPMFRPPSIKFPTIDPIPAYSSATSSRGGGSSVTRGSGGVAVTRWVGSNVETTIAKFKVPIDYNHQKSERIELSIGGRSYVFDDKNCPEGLAAFNELLKKVQK